MLQEAILNKIKGYLVDYKEFSKLDFSKALAGHYQNQEQAFLFPKSFASQLE